MKSRVVHVQIHGQQYAVRSDLDPQYISELAAYVDDKMRQAGREIATADALRIAVIAALNVADELFRARSSSAESQWLSRTADLERLVDEALAPPRKAAASGA